MADGINRGAVKAAPGAAETPQVHQIQTPMRIAISGWRKLGWQEQLWRAWLNIHAVNPDLGRAKDLGAEFDKVYPLLQPA